MQKNQFAIPYYHDYISPALAARLAAEARPVAGVDGLTEVGQGGGLETKESLRFLTDLYRELAPSLGRVLAQRTIDRKFLDERVRATAEYNRELGIDLLDPDYKTVLGLEDSKGRIVIGPKNENYCRKGGVPVAPLPDFLAGPHVTLFGPPDSAKMAINAMNAFHRKLPNEPKVVEKLLVASPMWGADDEDSKTPLRADLASASENLTACFEGNLALEEGAKKYALAKDHLALPIKRFPGLALPSTFLFCDGSPIPLHLYDFALHLFRNWENPRALVFYVPKLENEEEAAYIHEMVSAAERRIKKLHPAYAVGTVRLMIVLENPRAILRAHEIMDALHPYFAGASLGWHDYLASTARIFREDPNYRIPVKADPDIVIKYIKASHLLLAEAVGSRGGIKVGGMYGILPTAGNQESLEVTLKGFIKDVVTQMKRELTGFWVAHPDFVRLGLALVEAWKRREAGDKGPLTELVTGLLGEKHRRECLDFIEGEDIAGLDASDPGYVRSLIVADIKESDFIANNHPDEIRYNVFQSLQYITDWLSGNGCVALPTVVGGIPVRVMDDLATAERSRWEVWHELRHGRFALEEFFKIVHEEMNFIRRDLSNEKKIVQVKWDERTAKWYPIAAQIMMQLMTAKEPVEFATELLLPFTVESIRNADDPWAAVNAADPGKYRLSRYAADFCHYFEICGSVRFATRMAANLVEDAKLAKEIILGFDRSEIAGAASFHGDIGQSPRTLDPVAKAEQALVARETDDVQTELRELGERYRNKFGVKFLISAKGKTGAELLAKLKLRYENSDAAELENARLALWEISQKRMETSGARGALHAKIEALREKHGIAGASLALNYQGETQPLCFGEADKGKRAVTPETTFEIASLSKTVASAFAIDYFLSRGIPLSTPVNALLARTNSAFRLASAKNPAWAEAVTIAHLMSHSALNMHYVKGFPADEAVPDAEALLRGEHGYPAADVIHEPGKTFRYSGAGFLALEHLLTAYEEAHPSKKGGITFLLREYLDDMDLSRLGFGEMPASLARGYFDSGAEVHGGHLNFPAFAAGGYGTAVDMAKFLRELARARRELKSRRGISHDAAVEMLHATDKGCRDFMGCDMGLGVFVAEAGANRLAVHQGANEGFRALYIQCVQGPDEGKGFVLFANGDNKAVAFIAEAAQEILAALAIGGIDYEKFASEFRFEKLPQEQIVNLGYKSLVFDAFLPDLPEKIASPGELDPLAPFNLAVGAEILSVTNQRFARAENLISNRLPVFEPELFERQGKVMDSWETVRHNPSEFDALKLRLSRPASVRYVALSTKFHDGNQAEFIRLLGLVDGGWREILPKTAMAGHALLEIELANAETVSEVIVEMYPDGGLSRLGLYSDLPKDTAKRFRKNATPVRFPDLIPKTSKPLTLPYAPTADELARNRKRARRLASFDSASLAFGAGLVRASNEHYGPAAQVISPFPPLHMFDGLESARSRAPGHHEEVVLRLAEPTKLARVVLDFKYFVNNNPREVSIHGLDGEKWVELAARAPVKAFAGNQKEFRIAHPGIFSQLMVRTFPDGGINRIHAYSK